MGLQRACIIFELNPKLNILNANPYILNLAFEGAASGLHTLLEFCVTDILALFLLLVGLARVVANVVRIAALFHTHTHTYISAPRTVPRDGAGGLRPGAQHPGHAILGLDDEGLVIRVQGSGFRVGGLGFCAQARHLGHAILGIDHEARDATSVVDRRVAFTRPWRHPSRALEDTRLSATASHSSEQVAEGNTTVPPLRLGHLHPYAHAQA